MQESCWPDNSNPSSSTSVSAICIVCESVLDRLIILIMVPLWYYYHINIPWSDYANLVNQVSQHHCHSIHHHHCHSVHHIDGLMNLTSKFKFMNILPITKQVQYLQILVITKGLHIPIEEFLVVPLQFQFTLSPHRDCLILTYLFCFLVAHHSGSLLRRFVHWLMWWQSALLMINAREPVSAARVAVGAERV